MNKFLYGLKREYWEYKRMTIVLPIIVTAVFCVVAISYTWSHHYNDAGVKISLAELEDGIVLQFEDEGSKQASESKASDTEESDGQFWFAGVYLAVAWIAAMFYAISSLYNDRRDKSILYWKTLPVSELESVLIKYVFALVGFGVIALGVAWISTIVLLGYAQLVFPAEMLVDDTANMGLAGSVIWPLLSIATALFWCAPFFALLLFVSAFARKTPILILLVSVVVVNVLERIVFSSNNLYQFWLSHSPVKMLARFSELETSKAFLTYFFVDSFVSLVLGLAIAVVLILGAVWYRENRFEI